MPAPAPPRWPLALFAGKAVIAAVVVLAAAAAVYFGLSFFRPPAAPGEGRPVYSRPEFDRLVMGQAEADVVAAVGRPDTTSADEGTQFWHYKRRVRDPKTNAVDTDVQVVVEGGKVVAVNY